MLCFCQRKTSFTYLPKIEFRCSGSDELIGGICDDISITEGLQEAVEEFSKSID